MYEVMEVCVDLCMEFLIKEFGSLFEMIFLVVCFVGDVCSVEDFEMGCIEQFLINKLFIVNFVCF